VGVTPDALNQHLASAELGDKLTERLLNLLSQNVFTICGIVFVSIAGACGLVSIINQFRTDPEVLPPDQLRKFNRVSQGLAHGFGFLFSAMGVYGLLTGGVVERAYLTLMIALIAGGMTPACYDVFKWARDKAGPAAGHAIVEFFKKYGAKALAAAASMLRRKPPDDDKDYK